MPPRPSLSLAIPSTKTGDDYDTDDSVSEWSTGDPLWEKNNVKDREECFSPPAQMDTIDSAPHHSSFDFPSVHPNPIDAACAALAKERAPGGGVGRAPGVAMCVVERGEVVHTFAAGVVRITAEDEGQGGDADRSAAASASGSAAPGVDAQAQQEPREVDCDTMFLTASISKTVMAIACMQAVERGELDIDADLRDVARAAAAGADLMAAAAVESASRNLNGFPGSPITARHLLTHKSGLRDDERALEEGSPYRVDGRDHPLELWEYVARRLAPKGADFSFGLWTLEAPPGAARYAYSNAGFTLLGAALELATKTPLAQLIRERIFDPLGMTRSTFTLAEALVVAQGNIAQPHRGTKPLEHYGVAEWPAAQLRSSANDLGRLLCALTSPEGAGPLLQPASVATMLPKDFCNGLAWWGKDAIYSCEEPGLWEHGGMMDGARTHIWLWPQLHAGAVFLSNGTAGYKAVEAAVLAHFRSRKE
jgi:CubicO group peptidase (beta-lactamase class C family)